MMNNDRVTVLFLQCEVCSEVTARAQHTLTDSIHQQSVSTLLKLENLQGQTRLRSLAVTKSVVCCVFYLSLLFS